MASVLSFLGWGTPTPAPAPAKAASGSGEPAAPAPSALQRQESASGDEEFVVVDHPADVPVTAAVATPLPGGTPAMVDLEPDSSSPAPIDTSSSPSPSSSTRACRPYGHAHAPCRPYGHAHSPPALLRSAVASPVTSAAAPSTASAATPSAAPSSAPFAKATPSSVAVPSSSASSSSSATKRKSFADAAASSPVPESSSSVLAYAQDASLSLAEQIRAKIAELERETVLAAAMDPVDPRDYSTPTPRPLVRLPRESQRKYDPRTLWALAVEEPAANGGGKRARRGIVDTVAPSKGKAKPKSQARLEEKELTRARMDKEGQQHQLVQQQA